MDAGKLTEELSIKAVDSIMGIVQSYESGQISRAQAATGLSAVFDTVSGLVSPEVFNLITEASVSFKGAVGTEVSLAVKSGHIEGYIHYCGTGRVVRVNQASSHYNGDYNDPDADVKAKASIKQALDKV